MDIFSLLKFTQEWVDLGLITPTKLKELETKWSKGEDTNTEHHRWGVFVEFLKSKEVLDEATLRALYKLGANDPDSTMGEAMMADILRRQECPRDLLELAKSSEEKFLQKIANERLARRKVNY